jgi:hypothetical protein
VFGVGVAIMVYYNISKVRSDDNKTYKQHQELKIKSIKPETSFIKNNNDIVDFLFSIQDFYFHNPRTYIEMVKTIDEFLEIVEERRINKYYNGAEIQTLIMKKRDALNELAYIGTNLTSSKISDEKMYRAIERLEDILNERINIAYKEYEEYIYNNGYNNQTSILHTGPLPKNTYDNILEPNLRFDNELF